MTERETGGAIATGGGTCSAPSGWRPPPLRRPHPRKGDISIGERKGTFLSVDNSDAHWFAESAVRGYHVRLPCPNSVGGQLGGPCRRKSPRVVRRLIRNVRPH
jgi:hypothetical protein